MAVMTGPTHKKVSKILSRIDKIFLFLSYKICISRDNARVERYNLLEYVSHYFLL